MFKTLDVKSVKPIDTIQPCDTTQVRSDSDFCIRNATVQVRPLDQGNILCGLSRHVFLPWVKISGQSKFGKAPQYWSIEVVRILLFTSI